MSAGKAHGAAAFAAARCAQGVVAFLDGNTSAGSVATAEHSEEGGGCDGIAAYGTGKGVMA